MIESANVKQYGKVLIAEHHDATAQDCMAGLQR